MSRLIFEGDTTKRFGEKFPKPFIEEVRAYDNGVEVDIAFYFKVPNDDDSVAAFLANLKNEEKFSQSIVLSAIDDGTLNKLKVSKNFETLIKNKLYVNTIFSDSEKGITKTKIITFSDFLNGLGTPSAVAVKDDFYGLEGTRYMKVFGTLEIEYNSSGEMYITCFVKNN